MPTIRSTRIRAALFVCGLMFLIIVIQNISTYHTLKIASLNSARERLTIVADELGEMMEGTTQGLSGRMKSLASDTAILSYLTNPSSQNKELARDALATSSTRITLGAELRDSAGRRVLTTGIIPDNGDSLSWDQLEWHSPNLSIGPLHEIATTLVYPVVREVKIADRGIGRIVQWQRLAASEGTLGQMEEIIGTGATVYLANTTGDLWTDLHRRTPALPVQLSDLDQVIEYWSPGGYQALVKGAAIDRTPWTLVVELPFEAILAQARAVTSSQVTTGMLLLLISVGAVWTLIGRVTSSLSSISEAARAVRGGDYSTRVRVSGTDEVASLGRAFNQMARSIQAAHRQLAEQLQLTAAANSRNEQTTARLEHLIASSRAIIYTLQVTEKGPEQREVCLEWLSGNITAILGYTLEEALAPGWWHSNLHPDDRSRAELKGVPNDFRRKTYRFRDASGSYRWIQDEQRVTSAVQGDTIEVIGTLTDVTERRKLEDARDAAEAANYAKSEFLSRTSHELRTPMNAILGFAQLLELDVEGEENKESVHQILHAGNHLLKLINEVLDLARVEAGGMSLSMESVDLHKVVGETVDLLRGAATAAGVTIHVDTQMLYVHADQQRLKQVLLNLLSNAVKYNRSGGTVRISHELLADNRLRVVVTDTGRGITAEGITRLFTPFERLEAEGDGIPGTGFGLSLSKGLIEAMGGRIGVESQLGIGSRFWLELELSPVAIEVSPEIRDDNFPSRLDTEQRTLLCIEDNISNFDLIRRIFKPFTNVRIIPAMQGRVGLQLAKDHRPHAILLDVHLPDISGAQVLEELRRDPELCGIPVIVASADATPTQVERLMRGGARAYLAKPFDVTRLRNGIADALGATLGVS